MDRMSFGIALAATLWLAGSSWLYARRFGGVEAAGAANRAGTRLLLMFLPVAGPLFLFPLALALPSGNGGNRALALIAVGFGAAHFFNLLLLHRMRASGGDQG